MTSETTPRPTRSGPGGRNRTSPEIPVTIMRGRYDAARPPARILLAPGAWKSERTTMGNVAVAEELAGCDELDELYRLDASESDPEDEPQNHHEPAGEDEEQEDG